MSLVFDEFKVPYVHQWPLGSEEFEGAIKFKAEVDGKSVPVLIAFGKRGAFGTLRKRVLVVVKDRVMLELAGAEVFLGLRLLEDADEEAGSFVVVRPGDAVPLEFWRFTIVLHKHFVSGGFNSLAVLFNVADVKGMAEYGLVRARLEGVI